ncbi:MAG: transcriptional repressor [Desulfovibrio sp.]|nr:transcriptional repressor [Desulfovibrio sp.]
MSKNSTVSVADFLDFMSRKGLNTTAQRRVIAEAFFEFPGHHSLEDFYQHVLKLDAGIGQTTVYRTLKLLCDAGLATEIHFNDGITRYEVARPNSHHDHIVCLSCGKIVEIFDQRIEKLQREIGEKYGFRLSGHLHNLYGICEDCRKTEQKD